MNLLQLLMTVLQCIPVHDLTKPIDWRIQTVGDRVFKNTST